MRSSPLAANFAQLRILRQVRELMQLSASRDLMGLEAGAGGTQAVWGGPSPRTNKNQVVFEGGSLLRPKPMNQVQQARGAAQMVARSNEASHQH